MAKISLSAVYSIMVITQFFLLRTVITAAGRSPPPRVPVNRLFDLLSRNLTKRSAPATAVAFSASNIEPGSRPKSRFDNDPTVSCDSNPYQKRCTLQQPTDWQSALRYNTTYYQSDSLVENNLQAKRHTCVDFYNQTDGQLLWWQALQREATFAPEFGVVYLASANQCPAEDQIHFYLSDQNNTSIKMVEWQRGLRLRKQGKIEGIINVCFTASEPDKIEEADTTNLLYSFLYCLFQYGTGLVSKMTKKTASALNKPL